MNILQQVQEKLKIEIKSAVIDAGLIDDIDILNIILEKPKDKLNGDFSTNIAMQLAKKLKKSPLQIAEEIVGFFDKERVYIKEVDIVRPGFINFYMDNHYLTELIPAVIKAENSYGEINLGMGKRILVEYVSANPTGDLHLGHARGAAFGDSLCNIFDKAGFDVVREFYINDAGNQMQNLSLSIEARYFQALGLNKDLPEGGYQGSDIKEIAIELVKAYEDKYIHEEESKRRTFFLEYGLEHELKKLRRDLENFRVSFDVWFSETSLYQKDKITPSLDVLKERGYIYEKDGATWFKSTNFNDDKDRVLIKKDGSFTYLLPDIAYHKDKIDRGFDKLINLWGADHHGYVSRMKAAIEALGYEKDKLDIVIIQLVNLHKNGDKVKMSKRTGNALTMRDLIEEVGLDAARFFFAMRSADTHLDFDLDLAVSKSNENPVYYVQYAHARICSIIRQGKEEKLFADTNCNWAYINTEKEYDLLKKIGEFPDAVSDAAKKQNPNLITSYVYELATALHSFYNAEKVIDPNNKEKSRARLALMKATQITMKNALKLIGVSAPEKM
ncbi:arginine--tRNA ligase [Bacillus atrophaeus]|uniref:arginine--tRNA ligase n=1 Tax=Bacillus atrophaeus TaxID=1452 RepID=UPI000D033776|nr:arginine--tRNA ligase [Bacillus atrophaeus]MEC1901476.1 arginine--tRNA ligase [Bacillus atrophaeus]MEC2396881.1 arginine--tRNA ligase [Bacillus atrophaeus]MED4436536.1 arginine--tRNA ligase [Bacillus atrophaeus]MED4564610.1 arginine--tRNA ligase [Bacillus atrophaeus]MED4574817.1 arginine--tRNA ligase [Bacillus atrophaeus]